MNTEIEIWKDIPGYERLYRASNFGNIKSKRFYKILIPQKVNSGYLVVHLYKGGKRKIQLVHRLIALTFLENTLNAPEVNHKDSNRLHNYATNLEWVTRLENVSHSFVSGGFKPTDSGFPVVGTPLKGGEELRFRNQAQAEVYFRGKHTSAIYYNLTGRCKSAYGYVWRRE